MKQNELSWDAFNVVNQDKRTSFENLCRVLFKMRFCDHSVVLHSNPNNPGIEVEPVLSAEGNKRISFQSKYFEGQVNYTCIKNSCTKAVKYYGEELEVLYLFCNKNIKTDCNSYFEIKKILTGKGIELVLITRESVLDLAQEYYDSICHFFGLNSQQKKVNQCGVLSNAVIRQITDYDLHEYEFESLRSYAANDDCLYPLLSEVERNRALYVTTEIYRSALKKVIELGYIMISGNPGTGKTRTSEMIALKFAGTNEYEMHYLYGLNGIDALLDSIKSEKKKRFILIDDCMGQAVFDLTKEDENSLQKLISIAKYHLNEIKLVLCSRIKVLVDVKTHRIYENCLDDMTKSGRVVSTENMSRREKALILRNHVFERTDAQYYKDIGAKEKRCLKIVDHNPFIPRVIDHITRNYKKSNNCVDGSFFKELIEGLNNPSSVWKSIYEDDIATPKAARLLLKAIFSLSYLICDETECRKVFDALGEEELPRDLTINSWAITISSLNGSMIKREFSNGKSMIGFIDPSVHDFLENSVYKKGSIERESLNKGILFFKQVRKLYGWCDDYCFLDELAKKGTLADLIYYDNAEKYNEICIHVCSTEVCNEKYKRYLDYFINNPNAINGQTFSTKSACRYVLPNLLCFLLKSEKGRRFYYKSTISESLFMKCIKGIEIGDACIVLESVFNNLEALDFSFSVDDAVLLMEKATDHSISDCSDEIVMLDGPNDYRSIDDCADELQERVFEKCLDDLCYYGSNLPGELFEMFKSVIGSSFQYDFTEDVKSYFTREEDVSDSTNFNGFIESRKDNENSDTAILEMFSEPFPER